MDWFNQADDLCAAVRVACGIGQAINKALNRWSGIALDRKDGVTVLVPCSGLPSENEAQSIKRARQVMDLLGGAWTHTKGTDGRRQYVQNIGGVRVQVYGVDHEEGCTCLDPQTATA